VPEPGGPGAASPGPDAEVLVERADGVATVTLNRPAALNALTISMKECLLGTLRGIGHDRAVRAVVLTGAGRAF
jgi:2-(1,2-epoxy-1,2-dihydrophenyl)acetyl-CoA isomerase